jgi:hypothetical protein
MSTSDTLEAAGWYEGRATDTSAQQSALAARGYAPWPAVSDFLGEFSALTLHITRHQRDDTIWFDASKASAWAGRASVDAYAARAGTRLIPVGYAYHEHLLLMLGENGHLIGGYDDYLADVGSSPAEAIDNLIRQDLRVL